MKNTVYLIVSMLMISSCIRNNEEPDAWGNFNSRELMVSAENNGRITHLPVRQGDVIRKNDLIAITDTGLFRLQLEELAAGRGSISTRLRSIDAQNGIIDQQIKNLEVDIRRVEKMLTDSAATPKQLDDLKGRLEVLKKQKKANDTQKNTVRSELDVFDSKEAMLREQLDRCYIKSPEAGTILEKYSEEGEITAAGRPVVKIADLTDMELKVYISGSQLGRVKIGQQCRIRTDSGEKGYSEFTGRVVHISDRAEFTPKIIQTKEERVHLVYAVKIMVENDGSLKTGMPAEAFFDLPE